jgi:hypothetical protein
LDRNTGSQLKWTISSLTSESSAIVAAPRWSFNGSPGTERVASGNTIKGSSRASAAAQSRSSCSESLFGM